MIAGIVARAGRMRWLAAYAAAERRDGHIASGRHWRAVCTALAVALLSGGR